MLGGAHPSRECLLVLGRLWAIKEVQPHVASSDPNFRMPRGEGAKTVGMRPQCEVDQPRGRIVFERHGTCIRHMEVPADARAYGHTTVATRVPMQRHQP